MNTCTFAFSGFSRPFNSKQDTVYSLNSKQVENLFYWWPQSTTTESKRCCLLAWISFNIKILVLIPRWVSVLLSVCGASSNACMEFLFLLFSYSPKACKVFYVTMRTDTPTVLQFPGWEHCTNKQMIAGLKSHHWQIASIEILTLLNMENSNVPVSTGYTLLFALIFHLYVNVYIFIVFFQVIQMVMLMGKKSTKRWPWKWNPQQ